MGKNIVKVLVLGLVGWSVYSDHLPAILGLAAIDNNFAVMIEFGKLIVEFIYKACIAFLVIAAADYGVTKWKFLKDQKMSFKEIKDEYKNSEGDPHVKAALRQRRMQMLQQGAMDSVPEADFVVRNPIHVACAMKYDAETMQSPMLTPKGSELIAKKIIQIAEEHNVPILEDAAEGLGTIYDGKYLGTFGKCSALSFNGNKIITTTGGGMFVSNDEEMANIALNQAKLCCH